MNIRLVKKAQKGDDKAFLKLFQKLQEDIYRTAYVYVKNKDDALDIVQDVAYQSFKKINTLKTPEYFKTWIIRMTINCAINVTRRNKKVVPLIADFENLIGEEEQYLPLLSVKELIDILQEEEKSVILLRFYHDHTIKEISEILDIPLGTAKTVLYRAINKLRKNVKEAGEL
ncbi:sigma-70 family RNA polymerase sigma factor [Metabacillus halosaccharovorans]|uniref:sigma-70 family RNA polymerase sigma factor n=1 Tax=Metabacillus halosaccharovorans TaxID=930124 RepID=UPI001C1FD3EA|nr:sigma-70 family RNA polymerase sigma factor [Metabacillus halosaccharovorans]MBU7595036.1 sigma-70 family RNA polymerase sigma factor [Metabacillus halosaccharovorans]